MLFMVIEHFKGRDPAPVYARFRARGRMMPAGLKYHGSWIELNFARCFQVMECDDVALLMAWIAEWRDLTNFEVIPVVTSEVTAAAMKKSRAGKRPSAHR
ncbi:MAG: DUF3303 family protein [Rhizobiales bacterium]|nr:DUF3303 family protein [Hyphomicrobiales bacterium]